MLEVVIVGFWITVGIVAAVGVVTVVYLVGRAGLALGRLIGGMITDMLRWGRHDG